MFRFLFVLLSAWLCLLPGRGVAAEFKLKDGTVFNGSPLSPTKDGVIIKLEGTGTFSKRIAWEKFSQEALKELIKDPKAKNFAELLIELPPEDMKEEPDQAVPKAKKKPAIVVKEFPSPGRPVSKGGLIAAMFSTKIGFFILMVLYVGNLFAAYEIAVYRNRPPVLVCGVSAVAPLVGPVIFLCLPYHHPEAEPGPPQEVVEEVLTETPVEETLVEGENPAEPAKAEPVIFKRGEFSFNRRFFETRFSGFFKVMPSEAEKHLILVIKSAKGEFMGKRISKISATELSLQLFSAGASVEEPILFNDIFEVQVRHKDAQ